MLILLFIITIIKYYRSIYLLVKLHKSLSVNVENEE